MKNISYIFLFLIVLLFGCEKVIDVDLNEAHPEIIVEGNLSKFPFSAEVKLSKTGNYFGESSNDKISGASVIVESDLGERYNFNEVENGVYTSVEISPEEGVAYNLTVEIENQIYKASSKLNSTIAIDTLNYYYDEGFAFFDAGYIVRVSFTDPEDIENYYRIKIYKKDSLLYEIDDFIVFNDRLMNGNSIEVSLRGHIFEVDDTVSVQLITLDKGAYEFFDTFGELLIVNPGSAAPANPTSNISNGALGYFSAWSSDVKTVIIED